MPQLLKRLGSITPRCRRKDPVVPFSDPFSASPDGEGSPGSKELGAPSPAPKTKVILSGADRSPYVVASPAGSAKKQRLAFSTEEDQPCAALPMPMSPVSTSTASSKKKKKKQPPYTVSASPGCAELSPSSSTKKPRIAFTERDGEQHCRGMDLSPSHPRRRLELGTDAFDEQETAQPQDLRATASTELARPRMVQDGGTDQPAPPDCLAPPASARAALETRTGVGPSPIAHKGSNWAADSSPSVSVEASSPVAPPESSPAQPASSPAPPLPFSPRPPTQSRRPQTARPAAPRPPQALVRASSALLSGAAKAASAATTALTPRRLMSPGRLMSPRRMMSPGRVMTPRASNSTSEQTPEAAMPSRALAAAQASPRTEQRTPRSWLPSPRPSIRRSKATKASMEAAPRSTSTHADDGAGVGHLDTAVDEAAEPEALVKPMLSAVYDRQLTPDEVAAAISVCPEVAWLAQCALMCPLPPGWRQCCGDSADGIPPVLYSCEMTGECSELPPHLPRFSRLARLLMTSVQRPEDTAAAAAWLEREIQDAHAEAVRLKESWTQSVDPARGVKFWHDPVSRRSCWENPSAPADFIACVAERLLATEAFAKVSKGSETAMPRKDSARRSTPRARSAAPRAPAAAASATPAMPASPPTPGTARKLRKASGQGAQASVSHHAAPDRSQEASTPVGGGREVFSGVPERRRSRSKQTTNRSESQASRAAEASASVPRLALGTTRQDDDLSVASGTAQTQRCTDTSAGDAEAFAIFTPPGSPAKQTCTADPVVQSSSQAGNNDAAQALAGAAAALAVAAASLASARGPGLSETMTATAHEATLLPRQAEDIRVQAELETARQAEELARIKAKQEEEVSCIEHARLKAEMKAQQATAREEVARLKAEEEAQLKLEAETRLKAEEMARLKAEEEARVMAGEVARLKAGEEARQKLEEDARKQAHPTAQQRDQDDNHAQNKIQEKAARQKTEAGDVNGAVPAKKPQMPKLKLTVPAMPLPVGLPAVQGAGASGGS